MRILIVSDAWHPQINGVVRTYEDLNAHLENDGHVVRVIGPHDFPRRMHMPGYREIELAIAPARHLKKLVDDFGPETTHIATEGPLGWAMRRLCLKRGWPFTTAFHTHFPDYAALRAKRFCPPLSRSVHALGVTMMKGFHKPSGAVMTTTPSVEATLKQWGIAAPLHRLTRGVRTDIFHPGEKTLFSGLPRPVALFVGRVAVEKNILAFLDMPWTGSKVVVGGGPDLKDLQSRFPETLFTGMQRGHALADHYRSADVFVFPSLTETFGIVLIEAMACGLPIAGFPATGPVDVVTRPFLGCVDEDIHKAARTALAAPGTAAERFAWLEQNYTWEVAKTQFLDAQLQNMIQKI